MTVAIKKVLLVGKRPFINFCERLFEDASWEVVCCQDFKRDDLATFSIIVVVDFECLGLAYAFNQLITPPKTLWAGIFRPEVSIAIEGFYLLPVVWKTIITKATGLLESKDDAV